MFPHASLPQLALHLINAGILDKNQAKEAAKNAKKSNLPFISYLVKKAILTSQEILACCQNIFSLPVFDLDYYDKSFRMFDALPPDLIYQYRAIPLYKINNILHVGISDPTEQNLIATLTFHTECSIKLALIREDQLAAFIENNGKNYQVQLQSNLLKQINIDENKPALYENINNDQPLIKFVDNILLHAFQQQVSDIHIEPYENICRIRYRQHGILSIVDEIPFSLAERIITRLKVIAKLNIAEHRLPQDGRFQLNTMDVRITTCPVLGGEKIVLRLFNSTNMTLNINELGFTLLQKKIFLKSIAQPQGLILVTGPTGSGKTSTLYAALNYLNQPEKNISTVEDPIEIRLPGINQINVNGKIDLEFSTILRSLLRQDPDILMIGEIRDNETAKIAIQAAQTGHLVFSTLHTNNAVEAIARLQSMQVSSYNIATSLSLIIAQRLIRKLCDACKQPEKFSTYANLFSSQESSAEYIYRAVGCKKCVHGYKNRFAIYELLVFDEQISSLVFSKSSKHTILSQARKNSFISLKEIMLEKILQGVTSLAELNRVL